MEILTVAFFGHRLVENPFRIEKLLDEYIRDLITANEYVDFLVGRNGDFDQYAASAVLRMRKQCGEENSALVLVLPYLTAEYLKNESGFHNYYTDVEVSLRAQKAHPKSAIRIRNREMVDRADLIICCIEHKNGGAWEAVRYAMHQGKKVINLAENSM